MATSGDFSSRTAAAQIGSRQAALDSIFLSASIFMVYARVVFSRGAWADDFSFIWDARNGGHQLLKEAMSGGRPLEAALMWLQFTAARNIDGLRWVRLFALFGVIALSIVCLRILSSCGVRRSSAAIISIGIAVLPSMQMFGAWASCASYSWAGVLGIVAEQNWDRRSSRKSCGLAVVALLGAFLIYPPAALISWFVPAVQIARRHKSGINPVKRVRRSLALMVISVSLAFTIATILNRLFSVGLKARSAPVSSYHEAIEKVRWFVTRPVVMAARPFLISSPGAIRAAIIAIPVLFVVVSGLLLSFEGPLRLRIVPVVAVLSTLVFSTISHIVLRESQIEFRFFPGICTIVWTLFVISSMTLIERVSLRAGFRGRGPGLVGTAFLGAAVTAGCFVGWQNMNELFLYPFQKNDRFLVEQLRDVKANHSPIVIRSAQSDWPARPNLGSYSLTNDLALGWVPVPFVQLLLAERGIKADDADVVLVPKLDTPVSRATLVIDTRSLISTTTLP